MSLNDNRRFEHNDSPKLDYWQKQYNKLDHNPDATGREYQGFMQKAVMTKGLNESKLQMIELNLIKFKDQGWDFNKFRELKKEDIDKLSPEERVQYRDFLAASVFTDPITSRAQANLMIAGYELGDNKRYGVDGINGPKTTAAIKSFQQSAGLEVTGKLDQETARALDLMTKVGMTKQEIEGMKPAQELNSVSQQRLAERDALIKTKYDGKGDYDTAKYQASLQMAGYDIGKYGIDGKLGPDTAEALKEFQKERGLKQTGKLNAETMAALDKATADGRKRLVSNPKNHFELGDKGLTKVKLPGVGDTYFEKQLVGNLYEFIGRCKKELGIDIKFESVFRSREYQKHLYDVFYYPKTHDGKRSPENMKEMNEHGLWGTNVVAGPDRAPHSMGTAFDLADVDQLISKGKFNEIIKIAKECGFSWQGSGDKVHFGNYDFKSLGYKSREDMVDLNDQVYQKIK